MFKFMFMWVFSLTVRTTTVLCENQLSFSHIVHCILHLSFFLSLPLPLPLPNFQPFPFSNYPFPFVPNPNYKIYIYIYKLKYWLKVSLIWKGRRYNLGTLEQKKKKEKRRDTSISFSIIYLLARTWSECLEDLTTFKVRQSSNSITIAFYTDDFLLIGSAPVIVASDSRDLALSRLDRAS